MSYASPSSPRVADTTLRVTHISSGRCVFARVHNVALQIWMAQATAEDALALRQAQDVMRRDFPDGISTLHWLRNMAGMPTGEARQHFAAMMEDGHEWFGEVGMVLDGNGFWAGAARAMLNGIRLTVGKRAGFRIFGNLEDGAAWLAHSNTLRTHARVPAHVLGEALEDLALRYGSAPARQRVTFAP